MPLRSALTNNISGPHGRYCNCGRQRKLFHKEKPRVKTIKKIQFYLYINSKQNILPIIQQT